MSEQQGKSNPVYMDCWNKLKIFEVFFKKELQNQKRLINLRFFRSKRYLVALILISIFYLCFVKSTVMIYVDITVFLVILYTIHTFMNWKYDKIVLEVKNTNYIVRKLKEDMEKFSNRQDAWVQSRAKNIVDTLEVIDDFKTMLETTQI